MRSKVKAIQHILEENDIDLVSLMAASKVKAETLHTHANTLESEAAKEISDAHAVYNTGVAKLRQDRDAVISISSVKAQEAAAMKKNALNIHASVKRIG